MMRKEYDQYLELIKKNPTLPTVCFVEAEIVADDCRRWIAQIGSSEVKEYINVKMRNEYPETLMKEDVDEYEEYLMEYEDLSEEQAKQKISEIIWKKAIFLNVDLPSDLIDVQGDL